MIPKKSSLKRTPLQTSFVQNRQSLGSTSRLHSIYSSISLKSISVEEHNKVLIQNQRLAKENALLKSHLNNFKESHLKVANENVDLIQRLNNTESQLQTLKAEVKNKEFPNAVHVCDRIQYVVSLLMDGYLDVGAIKQQFQEFGNKVETIKGIMSSLKAMMENENQFKGMECELNSDHFDPFGTDEDSMAMDVSRHSLSSQEQELRRRMSSERIKRDFQVMSELSTILELSTEQRISSCGSGSGEDQPLGPEMDIEKPTAITSSAATVADVDITTEATNVAKSGKRNTKPMAKKVTITKKSKNKTSNEKQCKTKVNSKTENVSSISVFDFSDDENKENVPPLPLVPKRQSRRIRAKNVIL